MNLSSRLLAPLLFLSFCAQSLAKEGATEEILYSASTTTLIKTSNKAHNGQILPFTHQDISREKKIFNSFEKLPEFSFFKFRKLVHVAQKGTELNNKNAPSSPIKKDAKTETGDPSRPLQPDETVENVIHYLRIVSDEASPQGKGELKTFTALLLKDGRVFENEELAPSVFDPAKRPIGSTGTGRWQRDGEAYALAFSDGTEGTAVSSAAITFPAPPSMILIGLFEERTATPHQILPHRFNFFKDGSLILERTEQIPQSGHYKINMRSIEITDEQGTWHSFLFGVHHPLEKPQVLVIGNKLYQRIEEEE